MASQLANLDKTRLLERKRDAELTADIKAAVLRNRPPEDASTVPPPIAPKTEDAAPLVFTHQMNTVVAATLKSSMDQVLSDTKFAATADLIRAACSQMILGAGYAAATQAAAIGALPAASAASGGPTPPAGIKRAGTPLAQVQADAEAEDNLMTSA